MGVFSKLKNIFYDEEYIDEPEAEIKKVDKVVKKEVEEAKPRVEEIKITKEEPKREEIKRVVEEPKSSNDFSERELFRSERTFNFTEFDDDEELPPRRNVLNPEPKVAKRVEVQKPAIPEQPKIFKPSPVISPIYGILDKDYKKDEVVSKTVKEEKIVIKDSATTYDTVRRKAYGTLEDELEDTLNSMNKLTPEAISNEVNKIDESVNELDKKTNKIEDLISKIESTTSDISVGELEDKMELEHFDDEDDEPVSDKTMTNSTLEHDLFNLIDSMYDDKED
ncbi:MAG: hypothetical protein MSH48_00925 [Mollicutes bacterium]|nr:hypothetical protein [Mollicutes bacterium]